MTEIKKIKLPKHLQPWFALYDLYLKALYAIHNNAPDKDNQLAIYLAVLNGYTGGTVSAQEDSGSNPTPPPPPPPGKG